MNISNLIDNILQDEKDFKLSEYKNILRRIEKEQLIMLEKRWNQNQNNQNSLIHFIRLFIQIIAHRQDELLFLVMGLIDLFQEITSNTPELTLQDVTSFICQSDQVGEFQAKIEEHKIPESKRFDINKNRVRVIDLKAPKVIGERDDQVYRLIPSLITTDSIAHPTQSIKMGTYARYIDKIITLDVLGTTLNVYNLDCKLNQKIGIKQDKESIILSFAWSIRQQRIGMAMKSHNLCFFDQIDNFTKPALFTTIIASSEYQTGIWYLENYNMWITTDATLKWYEWDLVEEKVIHQYSSKLLTGTIIQILEITHLRLIATASLDKQILIWKGKDVLLQIPLTEFGGIHTIIYSYYFQVILSAGYSTTIQVHSIDPQFLDVTLIGQIQGHTSMLTALQMLGSSPILASSDDSGTIRLWDIRTFVCIQKVNYGKRTQILQLIDLSEQNKMFFLGSRLNMIYFNTTPKKQIENYPVRLEFMKNQIIVGTRSDIQYIDIYTGLVEKILVLQDVAQVRFQRQKFLIADQKGNINQYFQLTGEVLKKLKGHSGEIYFLKLDNINQLIVSASRDQLLIQKLSEPLREIHFQKEVSNVEFSVYHNIILVSHHALMTVWDYELFKLLGAFNLNDEITCFQFFNAYKIFMVGTVSCCQIYSFIVRDQIEIYCDLIATIQLEQTFITEIDHPVCTLQNEYELIVASKQAIIYRFDLQLFLNQQNTQKASYERINYNGFRKAFEELKEDLEFKQLQKGDSLNLNKYLILKFQALKKNISSMNFLDLDERHLIVSCFDGLIKIFTMQGLLQAAININHPLPLFWDIKYIQIEEKKRRIIYSLKIIDVIQNQIKREDEKQKFSLNEVLKKYRNKNTNSLNQKSKSLHIKPICMKDEYSPRDLQFEKVRKDYYQELMGPSLKQMENHRKIMEYQNEWKRQQQKELEQLKQFEQIEKQKHKQKEREPDLKLFSPHFNQIQEPRYLHTRLEKILDKYDEKLQSSQQKIEINENLNKKIISKRKILSPSSIQSARNASYDFFEYAEKKRLLKSPDSTRINDGSSFFSRSQVEEKIQLNQILEQLNSKVKSSRIKRNMNFKKQKHKTDNTEKMDQIEKKEGFEQKQQQNKEKLIYQKIDELTDQIGYKARVQWMLKQHQVDFNNLQKRRH